MTTIASVRWLQEHDWMLEPGEFLSEISLARVRQLVDEHPVDCPECP